MKLKALASLLPSLHEVEGGQGRLAKLVITAGGFEGRAGAVFENFHCEREGRALVLRYLPEDPRNRLREVIQAARDAGFRVGPADIIEFARLSPDGFFDNLRLRLEKLEARELIIDVSAMSKMAIFICLEVAREMGLDVVIFYAEAAEYGPSREQYRGAQLEGKILQPTIQVMVGVLGVVRVSHLSSVAMQGQPTAAIAFMSFNELLVQALIDAVCPGRLFLINGRPPERSWREEATAWIHDILRREWPEMDNPTAGVGEEGVSLPVRSVSTLVYTETCLTLLELYWKLAVDHRIVLAPTGSKMQTVGCFFVKGLHPDIHIEYPTPKGFLPSYSNGVGRRWISAAFNGLALLGELRRKERAAMMSVIEPTSGGGS